MLRLVWLALGAAALTPAATIISIGGTSSAYFDFGPASDTQVLATSWTTSDTYTDVSIFASLFNNSADSAAGMAYLTTSIGASASASSLVASAPFVAPSGANNVELLTVATLSPATYYLVLAGTSSSSDFGWLWVSFPALIVGPGVIEDQRYYANAEYNSLTSVDVTYPPGSTFSELDVPSNRVLFSVLSADVPEPASTIAVAAVLFGIVWRRRQSFQTR